MTQQPDVPAPSDIPVTDSGRVVVLASGAGSTMKAVLDAQRQDGYGARIVAVISDVPDAGALRLAEAAGVATAVVQPKDFADRGVWNLALAKTVQAFNPDLVLSAGFMRILSEPFLARFPNRVVNSHPALLPSFPGAHAVRDALAAGVKITGCTLHVVDAGVDTGPVLAQGAVQIDDEDDEATLHERIKAVERDLLVSWVPRLALATITVQGRRTIVEPRMTATGR
ncbi:phosphoribosylglycinamide formyltransferase-1 [Micrococcales bacterium KH10]|nr:phosphoribosylglycinamide formyltransferase-1 [Micrococcales bacterium KH10]